MADKFRNPIIKFFSSIPTILCIFILSRCYALIYSIVYPSGDQNKTFYIALTIALILCCLLSYLVLKHSKIAIWTMIIVLALYGLGSLIVGLFVPLSQYILKSFGIVLGLYWMYSACILYSLVRDLAKKVSTD